VRVGVKLYGVLRSYRPATAAGPAHRPFELALGEPVSVAALARLLAIPDGLVNGVAVNGLSVGDDYLLQSGDEVSLFPAAAGG
jgi:molybdopterin converting factor small subunit